MELKVLCYPRMMYGSHTPHNMLPSSRFLVIWEAIATHIYFINVETKANKHKIV